MPKAVNHFDFGGFEARNAVLQNLSAHASSPKEGQIDYLTGAKVGCVWNGTAWRPMDAALLTDGSIKIAALEVDLRARATHTGQQAVSTLSDFDAAVRAYRHDQFAAPNVAVSWGGHRLTSLAAGSGPSDAINLQQLNDAVSLASAGIDAKPSVRVFAVGGITLSGVQTIDGVTLSAGDRVLAGGQTAGAQNGVYVVSSGSWARAADADATGEITPGAEWYVEEGTAYGRTKWRCNNAGAITLGTTAISLVQSAAAMMYTAGFGLSLTGTVFAAQLQANSGLVATALGLALDTAVAARKYSSTITGDGTTSSFTLTHGLGTQDVSVTLRDSANALLLADIVAATANTATISFGAAPTSGATYRATVIG